MKMFSFKRKQRKDKLESFRLKKDTPIGTKTSAAAAKSKENPAQQKKQSPSVPLSPHNNTPPKVISVDPTTHYSPDLVNELSVMTESPSVSLHRHENDANSQVRLLPKLANDDDSTYDNQTIEALQSPQKGPIAGPSPGPSSSGSNPPPSSKKARMVKSQSMKSFKTNFLTRSRYFRKLTDYAFDAIDVDKSGCIDKKELYSGLLLIHINLAPYAGPAACRPMSRDKVDEVFDKMDIDQSGSLDKDEFQAVMTVLCSNIFSRIVMQMGLTLVLIPMAVGYFFDFFGSDFITKVEYYISHLAIFVWLKEFSYAVVTGVRSLARDVWDQYLPHFVRRILDYVYFVFNLIPEDVLESFPRIFTSILMGYLIVPWTFFKIDAYFTKVADKKIKDQ